MEKAEVAVNPRVVFVSVMAIYSTWPFEMVTVRSVKGKYTGWPFANLPGDARWHARRGSSVCLDDWESSQLTSLRGRVTALG